MQQLCDYGYDQDGYDLGREAIDLDDGSGCPLHCNVFCDPALFEEPCVEYDSWGCPSPPYCAPQGQCYSEYDSNGCLVDIYYTEALSPMEMACPGPYIDVSQAGNGKV